MDDSFEVDPMSVDVAPPVMTVVIRLAIAGSSLVGD
jgi:hypothetical protein